MPKPVSRLSLFTCAVVAGVLQGAGCLSMPPLGPGDTSNGPSGGSGVLVADSLTGTWLVSVDTANLAPFEITLFKVADETGSARLSGVSHLPEFASGVGMNVIQPGPLQVTLVNRTFLIRGLTV